MDLPIPEEQMARIRPVVDQVLAALRALSAELPDEADSALTYSPGEDGE